MIKLSSPASKAMPAIAAVGESLANAIAIYVTLVNAQCLQHTNPAGGVCNFVLASHVNTNLMTTDMTLTDLRGVMRDCHGIAILRTNV